MAAEASKSSRVTKLKVTDCKLVFAGKNKRGDEYSLFEVTAARPDGKQIEEKLRSFCALPIDQEIEVVVTPFPSEKHGMSFTLAPTGPKGTSNTQRVNELVEEVQKLAQRVTLLEGAHQTAAAPRTTTSMALPPAGDPGNPGVT